MENCPKCKSKDIRKDGIVKQKQRFLCKDCQYHFTVEVIGKPEKLKRDALILYLEGLGFRSIGRFLNVSHVAVFNWIKSFGENIDEIRSDNQIDVIELDEMHTYISSKKTSFGSGLLLIEMGENSSIAKLVQEKLKPEKDFGTRLKEK
jgi:transposase-like protein